MAITVHCCCLYLFDCDFSASHRHRTLSSSSPSSSTAAIWLKAACVQTLMPILVEAPPLWGDALRLRGIGPPWASVSALPHVGAGADAPRLWMRRWYSRAGCYPPRGRQRRRRRRQRRRRSLGGIAPARPPARQPACPLPPPSPPQPGPRCHVVVDIDYGACIPAGPGLCRAGHQLEMVFGAGNLTAALLWLSHGLSLHVVRCRIPRDTGLS